MKIAVASDHGGFKLKEEVKAHLLEKGLEVHNAEKTEIISLGSTI